MKMIFSGFLSYMVLAFGQFVFAGPFDQDKESLKVCENEKIKSSTSIYLSTLPPEYLKKTKGITQDQLNERINQSNLIEIVKSLNLFITKYSVAINYQADPAKASARRAQIKLEYNKIDKNFLALRSNYEILHQNDKQLFPALGDCFEAFELTMGHAGSYFGLVENLKRDPVDIK